jgi:hypothetical protein
MSEKEHLASRLSAIENKPVPPPLEKQVTPMAGHAPLQSEKVKIIPPQFAKAQGITTLASFPNIVSGMVKDDQGDLLPNIIVEVKDAAGNPVRAFKTNKLGQFSASTALANGKYTIELEDPQNTFTFDVIAIELTGALLEPLGIMAKNRDVVKKQGERAQLYQSLFGSRPTASPLGA